MIDRDCDDDDDDDDGSCHMFSGFQSISCAI